MNKLGEGERKVRLGQDSLPNINFPSQKVADSSNVILPAPILWYLQLLINYRKICHFLKCNKFGCLSLASLSNLV
jgi:hypothetical protein